MTFQNNAAQNNNFSRKNSEPAHSFLNIYLPSKGGTKPRKLGAIALRMSDDSEKQLGEWLLEDPSRAQLLASKVIMDFQMNTKKAEFDLS